MSSPDQQLFGVIANRIEDPSLKSALFAASGSETPINLFQELETVHRCLDKVNELLLSKDTPEDFAGITNVRRILKEHGQRQGFPDIFTGNGSKRNLLLSLKRTIEVGNKETGSTYPHGTDIKNGDPLSVFQWFLYDGVGRMIAIHLGIPNDAAESQKDDGDWIACALTEAAVVLAEEGNLQAKAVVKNMLDMKFMDGWILKNEVIERARKTTAN